jgi:hypothetical protein
MQDDRSLDVPEDIAEAVSEVILAPEPVDDEIAVGE